MRLPYSWRQVTIAQYLIIHDVIRDETLDWVDKNIRILSALTGLTAEQLEAYPMEDIKRAVQRIAFLFEPDKIPKLLPKYFFLKGRLYRVRYEVNKLTAGQYIDIAAFTKDADSVLDNLHSIMAVIARPVFTAYDGANVPARAKLFYDHLPMSVIYPVALFFCNLLRSLTPAIEDYLLQQSRTILTEMKKDLMTAVPPSRLTGDGC